MFQLPGEEAWIRFVQQQLPELRRRGWQIDIHPGFAYDLTAIDARYAEIDESAADDWFDLDLGVVVDGQRIGILPVLLRLIRQSLSCSRREHWPSGAMTSSCACSWSDATGNRCRWLCPSPHQTDPGDAWRTLYARADGWPALRLSKADGARLAGTEGLAPHWRGASSCVHSLDACTATGAQPGQPPASLNATCGLPAAGPGWMQTLRELGAGGILGDDMGLGKTLQSLAHILAEKQAGRTDAPRWW